jgi:hypothetical protein
VYSIAVEIVANVEGRLSDEVYITLRLEDDNDILEEASAHIHSGEEWALWKQNVLQPMWDKGNSLELKSLEHPLEYF